MILGFDVWKKSQALKGMGLKYQGKNQLLYILARGDTENLQHPGSFMMFIFIFFTTGGYFFNYEDILLGIKRIVSFEKWEFSLRFPFFIHQYINE